MRLAQLRKQWHVLSREEKLDLIEKTNERRIESFKVRVKKQTKKKTKKRKGSTSTKKKSPSDLFSLLEKMTPEQRENFKLMAKINAEKTS